MPHIRVLMLVVATFTWPLATSAQSASPYVGQERRAIKTLSDQEVEDLLEARGMGLAKAAELNSYPGPLHVLQLADQLVLSDAQRASSQSLYVRMRENALVIGRQIIDAEVALDRAFTTQTIDPAILRSQVSAIAMLRGELRIIHLEAHLAQRSLLTTEQLLRYDRLRGYGGNNPPHHTGRHGG